MRNNSLVQHCHALAIATEIQQWSRTRLRDYLQLVAQGKQPYVAARVQEERSKIRLRQAYIESMHQGLLGWVASNDPVYLSLVSDPQVERE